MSYVGKPPKKRQLNFNTIEYTGSGIAGPYALDKNRSGDAIDVWVGGAWQSPSAYSITGSTLTLGGTVSIGIPIVIKYREGRLGMATPGPGAVNTVNILDGSFDPSNLANDTAGNVIQFVGGNPTSVDPYSIVDRNDQLRIMINSWRIATNSGQTIYNMVDGISDTFSDETGIDTGTSTNETFNSGSYTNASLEMVLVSDTFIANSVPDEAYIAIQHQAIDAVTINTDLIAEISRDGGSTWSVVTLANEGTVDISVIEAMTVFSGLVDISGQPSGTSIKYRLTTTTANQEIHAVSVQWR